MRHCWAYVDHIVNLMTNSISNSLFSALDQTVLPLEVHTFERNGVHYAFDARNYVVLTLDAVGASVLSLMRDHRLEEIESTLAKEVASEMVRAHYLRFLHMIEEGVLSIESVTRPTRPPFYRLVLMLAGGCNMGCKYCFEKDVPIYQKLNLLTREAAEKTLEWYFRHQEGPKAHIQLYGGEPLLNWDVLTWVIERMESWAVKNEKELTKYLITNGTLLNKNRIAYLKAHEVSVQVSVDGDKETHDRFRVFKSGAPTLEIIKPNIRELESQSVDFNLRAVLTRTNKDPESVIQGLRSLGGKNVSFEVVATSNPEAQFDKQDWKDFETAYRAHINAPFTSWATLPDEIQSTIISICEGRKVYYGCGAGVSEVTIAPDGSIYECQRIYRTPYSNVSEDKGPATLASTYLTMVDERDVCRNCWARYLCGGGCMHQAHVGHGQDTPLPEYCQMKYETVEAAIVKIHELRQRSKGQQELVAVN